MPKKRSQVYSRELLDRSIEIQSMEASVRLSAESPRGLPPQIDSTPWLELTGLMNEPIRDVRAVLLSIYPTERTEPGPMRPASVGSIIQTRPEVSVVVPFPEADFDRIWTLALLGQLKYAYLLFTKPLRNKALVVSVSFSTHPEE